MTKYNKTLEQSFVKLNGKISFEKSDLFLKIISQTCFEQFHVETIFFLLMDERFTFIVYS